MVEPTEAIRRDLARLCRRKRSPTHAFTPRRPTKWRPYEVLNPRTGQPFLEHEAWERIAALIDSGHPIATVTLEKPPGRRAYVLTQPLEAGVLYVKLELGSGLVLCRSFYLSERPE